MLFFVNEVVFMCFKGLLGTNLHLHAHNIRLPHVILMSLWREALTSGYIIYHGLEVFWKGRQEWNSKEQERKKGSR